MDAFVHLYQAVGMNAREGATHHVQHVIPHVELVYPLNLGCDCVKGVLGHRLPHFVHFLRLSYRFSYQLGIEEPLLGFYK